MLFNPNTYDPTHLDAESRRLLPRPKRRTVTRTSAGTPPAMPRGLADAYEMKA